MKIHSLVVILILFISACTSKKSRLEKGAFQGADSLARKVIQATNGTCWDSVHVIQWTFVNRKHVWDKKRNFYRFEKGDNVVLIDLDNYSNGCYFKKGVLQPKEKSLDEFKDAYNAWANDAFWLNPFWKFFDEGVERKTYLDEEGKQHLLVYYQHGTEIGDVYDWTIGENNLPTQWSLFVKIIPINDVTVMWQNWKEFDCGLKISTLHENSIFDLQLSEVELINGWEHSRFKKDPFTPLLFP